jgi:hypothetical protein
MIFSMEKSRTTKPYTDFHAISWRESGIALLVLFAVTVRIRWQAFLRFGTHYLGGSHADAGLYLYLFRYHLENLFSGTFFQTNAFFPYPLSLAWSDNFIFPALLASPFAALGVPHTILYNGVLLSAHLALAYATFRVVYIISGNRPAALLGGATALSLGYLSYALGHPQLIFGWCFPVALELLFRGIERPIRYGFLFGLLFLITFLTTVYYAIFLLIFPPVVFLSLLSLHPSKHLMKSVGVFLISALPGALLLIPFALPYLEVQEVFGSRAIGEMYAFRANGLSFLSATPLSWLYGFSRDWSHAEAHFFPGLCFLVLLAIPWVHLVSARPLVALRRAVGALFFLLFATPHVLKLFLSPRRHRLSSRATISFTAPHAPSSWKLPHSSYSCWRS